AVGYTLDEIPNDITRKTPASFEPTIDYVVVKIPKWAFEKFPAADPVLTTQMKSVGEVMAIGRTFNEAFLKGLRSLEQGRGFKPDPHDDESLRRALRVPTAQRAYQIAEALRRGIPVTEIHEATHVDLWFLAQMKELTVASQEIERAGLDGLTPGRLREVKRKGFSDAQLARFLRCEESEIRGRRLREGIRPVYLRVDTCAAEFESFTPYLYSSYEDSNEAEPTDRRKIVILGSGPNRIGQGIEFDYCCCHASFALREDDFETIMVNCNPETVSTDYDTSDRLYFEPLTFEDVMNVVEEERPTGVIVQFGGQTPLNLALPLFRAGVPIIGTSPESIDLAEDRKRFGRLLVELGIPQPENGTATTADEALEVARRISYPVLVRPSYVLGGRAMVVAYGDRDLEGYIRKAVEASPDRPVLIDRFLEDAVEVDVDALADGADCVIAGIQEHIEEAGIHSGDSSCVLPAHSLSEPVLEQIRSHTRRLAGALNVVGLMNIQYAVKDGLVYVLEVNPRASRTVPFVSKATGVPIAKIAARIMTGRKLAEFGLPAELSVHRHFIKTPVFPFSKFPRVDPVLGPEMRSTGEVMGIGDTFGMAFNRAQMGAGITLPKSGTVFISVNERGKEVILPIAVRLAGLGFRLVATRGTAEVLRAGNIAVTDIFKVNEGRPNVVDAIKSREIHLVINTPLGRESFYDEKSIRRAAMRYGIPCITTITGASAAASAMESMRDDGLEVRTLQEYHQLAARSPFPLKARS
ncbi:MAG: carbamoyl-phosphate synthase large subunit, partial [Acidobacteria bacterium]|nr:carbamoyl-phosphate synthase large subunit [Acidobacteriota bacterium]